MDWEIKIDKYSPEPLYQQVRKVLEREIGRLAATREERLPPTAWIAEKLGVSTLTVDLAMEELVSRGILYRRPRLGTFIRARKSKQNFTIGLITLQRWYNPDLGSCEEGSLLFSDYVHGVKEEIALIGGILKFCPFPLGNKSETIKWPNNGINGFIVFEQISAEISGILRELSCPYVILNPLFAGVPGENTVSADDEGGVYKGVKHLLDCGYQKVIYCGSGLEERNQRKLAGYRRALLEKKIVYHPDLVLSDCPVYQAGSSVLKVLEKVGIPCGILVVNDTRCHVVAEAVQKKGYKVPEEVGLVSFDDTIIASCHVPALTAVRKPRYQMGKKSVELLTAILKKELEPPVNCVLETTLIVRESTADIKGKNRKGGKQNVYVRSR